MASYARCLCLLFLLALCFSLQTQARESKFFSKYTHHFRRNTLENPESISISPAQSPSMAPAPAPESEVVEHGYGLYGQEEPVKSTNVVGEVKYVEAQDLDKKTFRDFVMANPNDSEDGWNGIGNEKKGMSEYVEDENSFPENKGDEKTREKRYLVNGKYYYGYVTKGENENKKQGVSEYVEDENTFPEGKGKENEYESENQGMGEKRYLVNGKYYTGYVTKSGDGNGNGNENEKQGMSEYVEDENSLPENQGTGNEYETEKGEKKYLVNGKYYSGYVTGSENGYVNEKQGMSEFVEDEDNLPVNKGNEYEAETQGMDEKRYLVNRKYYSGYVTKSENENQDEKQGMSEYVDDENNFPENKENGNEYETEKQRSDEKRYLVNGEYYSGYVTKSENGNGNENEKPGMNEYMEENSSPENTENENEYETKKQGMSEKKYLVNGKYYNGYVTKSEKGEQSNLNSEDLAAFNNKNEYGNGYNKNEFYDEDSSEGEEGYNYNPNGHRGSDRYNGIAKKLSHEYEKEQEYRETQNGYLP